ncbi:Hsp20/alpha crystallin family protein [Thermodesulfatator atlanticus]|uniref:Hsp20/alpha crystallin family protein n=1 Tax=Thermodesulfatator atlanticus TaxID=501497 RepID=UPI0003B4774C|nr:Hsp20/alpha crystallin family protein [Thermodesulfatator atlanticus]
MAVIQILWSEGLERLRRQMHAYIAEAIFCHFRCLPLQESWIPPVDIFENPNALIVMVTCPGAKRDSLEIRLDGRFLYVKGYRYLPLRGSRIYQLEGEYGPFERLIRLPFPVSAQGAEALFEDGILKILLPKQGH